ncbi:MAG: phenylpropionate dioxygenase-like ring-hydroxylating dioxygenase large terminal subunit [Gammaproteobacteria bacterium]|jgi:phenylpropionate dioxygenase-like ring-hydroxylating dioxygenase large terminal subunit
MKTSELIDISALVKKDRVHRDVYIKPAIFELEMERIFNRSWLFVGHESQVPDSGDFITSELTNQSVIMVNHHNNIHVLFNRCPHRGAKVCEIERGNAHPLRCPYHGWVFDTDGRLLNSSLHTDFDKSIIDKADLNMTSLARVTNHRGFVFACLTKDGPGFEEALGPILSAIDNLVDRSPVGEVELIAGIHRHVFPGNWKMQLENIQDAAHPRFIHTSSNEAGRKGRQEEFRMRAEDVMSGNNDAVDILDASDAIAFPGGHSYMAAIPIRIKVSPEAEKEYLTMLAKRHGPDKTESILSDSRHFNVIYPQIMLQSAFQTMKVLRPVAVDRTEVSVYVFRLKGAPEEYDNVAVQFANATNSAASIILQDDLATFANIQEGLTTSASDWVLFANGLETDTSDAHGVSTGQGFTELPMRNQFVAWSEYMSISCADD